jgi:hypothetical protein
MDHEGDRSGDARRRHRESCGAVTGISIDSHTIAPGEAYFAIKGDVHVATIVPALKARSGCAELPPKRPENGGIRLAPLRSSFRTRLQCNPSI